MKIYNVSTTVQYTIQAADEESAELRMEAIEDVLMSAAAQLPGVTDVAFGGGHCDKEEQP